MRSSPYYAEQEAFIDSVSKMVATELAPKVSEWEKRGHFPNEVFTLLGKQGYLGLLISEEYGGVGGDYKLAGAWCEAFGELASVGLTVAVNMHSLVISHGLEKFGSEEAKRHWLPRAKSRNRSPERGGVKGGNQPRIPPNNENALPLLWYTILNTL